MLFGSTNPTYSLTGTCSRAPPVDLWGPDDERSSRPVLREREGESPSRHSPEPHARFDGRELETERLVRVTEVGQPDGKPRA